MKKVMMIIITSVLCFGFTAFEAAALNFSAIAGDQDYGANRDEYDNETNMDWFVFGTDKNITGNAVAFLSGIGRHRCCAHKNEKKIGKNSAIASKRSVYVIRF
jgi:hypothetical protein